MTDFVRDLEAELLAAARRRSSRRRLPRPAVRPIARRSPRRRPCSPPSPRRRASRTSNDRRHPVRVRSRSRRWTLPEICDPRGAAARAAARAHRGGAARAPGRRGRATALPPTVADAPSTWLPVERLERLVAPAGRGCPGAPWCSATNDVRDRPSACGTTGPSRGPGACLVASAGEPERVRRCFTLEDIRAGRAFARAERAAARPGCPVGVTRGRVRRATARRNGIPVRENALQREIPGLRAGDDVQVRLLERRPTVIVAAGRRARGGDRRTSAGTPERRRHHHGPAQLPGATSPRSSPSVPERRPLAREIAGILDARGSVPSCPRARRPRADLTSSCGCVCDNVRTYAAT